MVKHSLIFVCKLLYQNVYDFVKRHLFLLLLLAKSADISTLDTPLPLMSATVSIFRAPPPLKNADVLYGRPHTPSIFQIDVIYDFLLAERIKSTIV